MLLVVILLALFPGGFAGKDPYQIDPSSRLTGPSREHPLGTDELGRDVWSRVVHGASISLTVALGGVGAALLGGSALGVISGTKRGLVDNLVMRMMDVLFAFPVILLALMIIVGIGAGTRSIIIALGIVYSPRFARIARGATLVVREELYVEAARALGLSDWRIITKHILPNIFGPLIIELSVSMGFAVIVEASLSFLGMGLPPPHPAWGSMLARGTTFMEISPWVVIGPGLAITMTVVSFNLLGDGLRDIFDPRLRQHNI